MLKCLAYELSILASLNIPFSLVRHDTCTPFSAACSAVWVRRCDDRGSRNTCPARMSASAASKRGATE
jgi:hypothetical protein